MHNSLTTSAESLNGAPLLRVTGACIGDDVNIVRQAVRTALAERPVPPRIYIDLTGVTTIDVVGLGVLVGAQSRAHAIGSDISLVCPPNAVLDMLGKTRIAKLFYVYPDEAAATCTTMAGCA